MNNPLPTISNIDKSTTFFCCFDGQVEVIDRKGDHPYSDTKTCSPSPTIFAQAEEYLKLWPDIYAVFPKYVRYIRPFEVDLYPDNAFLSSSGCSSSEPGLINVTARHPFVLAEALVHEMAHMKLISMGVDFEYASAIITNTPHERYYSPVKECDRPMTALFHAVYSFSHILHINNLILESDVHNSNFSTFLMMAKDTLGRVESGHETVAKNIRTDADGEVFIREFLLWNLQNIKKTREILDKHGIE